MHRFDTPSCLVICYAITKRVTLLWVRLHLGEQPFSFGYDWRVIGGIILHKHIIPNDMRVL